MKPKFNVGQKVWHDVYEEVVEIQSVDPRVWGPDDYRVCDINGLAWWASDVELSDLED